MKLNVTQNLAAILRGYGKKKAHLHSFKFIKGPRGTAEQTTDQVIYKCAKVNKIERKGEENRPTKMKLANK